MLTNRFLKILLLTVLISLGWVSTASAHGDGEKLELYRVPVGDYYVSVWSLPGVLRTGEVHFETAVFDQNYRPVTDCDIKIQLAPADNPTQSVTLQTRQPTPETYYRHEIEEDVWEADLYDISVFITDPTGNTGQVAFQVEVIEIPLWLKIPIYSGLTVAAFSALFLLQKGLVLFGIWKPKPAQIKHPATPKRPVI